jgi:hypothetical protein
MPAEQCNSKMSRRCRWKIGNGTMVTAVRIGELSDEGYSNVCKKRVFACLRKRMGPRRLRKATD